MQMVCADRVHGKPYLAYGSWFVIRIKKLLFWFPRVPKVHTGVCAGELLA